MSATVIVGAQWGDEGKAKMIDLLAEEAAMVVRYQGGANAGHTVVRQGETFKFHLIPSGILYPGKICIIGPGTVINPTVLHGELQQLQERGISTDGLKISPRSHVTLPWHVQMDEAQETLLGDGQIGTTRRGIGPTYVDKVDRIGLRVGDLLLPDNLLEKRLHRIAEQKNPILTRVFNLPPLKVKHMLETCLHYRELLKAYVCDTDALLETALLAGEQVLLEGAQGAMLDIDHGTYPYVTSSNPTAGGACTGAGIGPRSISQVIGVAKAYTTRVGSGPFPTELTDEAGHHLASVGREFGTTTGRPRRCGWFDAVAMRHAVRVNGIDSLAITKLDVMDGLSEVKLCVAYRNRMTGELCQTFPWQIEYLADLEPVYETLPGWMTPTSHVRTMDDLPLAAQDLLHHLSQAAGTPVSMVSVGPDRSQTIRISGDCLTPLTPWPKPLLRPGC
jgi:adenylosuccinate synthase